MNSILNSLTQHTPEAILFLLVLFFVALGFAIKAARDSAKIRNRFKELLEGSRGESLELILADHLRERMKLQSEVDMLRTRVNELEAKMRRTKRYLGVVRYDAFDDVGGNQSFALALYDDDGNGAIVNSLVGRTDCRVYCKPLSKGVSDRSLSGEEERAMRVAAGDTSA